MNLKSTIRSGYVMLVALFLSISAQAQTGLSLTAGLAGAKNQQESINLGSSIGAGYTGAVEARFLGQDMYFVIQLQYAKYKLLTEEGFEFPESDNNFQIVHGKIGMGFTLFRFGYNNSIRAKVLGVLDKTLEYTSITLVGTEFPKMNESTVGMMFGLGVDLGRLVIDVEYERGLINAFYKYDGANFDYFSVRTGILIN